MIREKWSNILNHNLELQVPAICVIGKNTLIESRSTKPLTPAKALNAGFFQLLFLQSYNYGKIKIEKPVKCYLGLF